MMERRKFLRSLAIGSVAIAISPEIIAEVGKPLYEIETKGLPQPNLLYYSSQMSYEDFKEMCDYLNREYYSKVPQYRIYPDIKSSFH